MHDAHRIVVIPVYHFGSTYIYICVYISCTWREREEVTHIGWPRHIIYKYIARGVLLTAGARYFSLFLLLPTPYYLSLSLSLSFSFHVYFVSRIIDSSDRSCTVGRYSTRSSSAPRPGRFILLYSPRPRRNAYYNIRPRSRREIGCRKTPGARDPRDKSDEYT